MPLQPIPNYISNLPNPAEQIQKDLQFYVNMQQVQAHNNLIAAQVQERQMKVQAAREKQIADARTYEYLKELNENPTVEGIRRATILLPDKANELKIALDSYTEEEKRKSASDAASLLAAVYTGDTETALKQIGESATAYKNSGKSSDANKLLMLKRQLEQGNKSGALATSAMIMAQTLPPEQFAAAMEQLSNLDTTRRSKEALAKGQEIDARFKAPLYQSQISQNYASAESSRASAASSRETAKSTRQTREQDELLFPSRLEKEMAGAEEARYKARTAAVDAQAKERTGIPLAEAQLAAEKEKYIEARYKNEKERRFGMSEAKQKDILRRIEVEAAQKYGLRKAKAGVEQEEEKTRGARIEADIAEKTGLPIATAKLDAAQAEAGIKGIERRFAADRIGTEIAKTETEIKKMQSDMQETKRKAIAGPDRTPGETTLLSKYSSQGSETAQAALRANRLADKFAKSSHWGGVPGWTRDKVLAFFGAQGSWDLTKKEYIEIANKLAMERLPSGPASNQDVVFAREALLSPNANPTIIAKALRVIASVQEAKAREFNFRTKWLWRNRHEGPAEAGMEIEGVKVAPGQTIQEALSSKKAVSRFSQYREAR